MTKAKIKLKLEVSKEFADSVKEEYIEQILQRVAHRIVSDLTWEIENPNLPGEERFDIDKFDARVECGTGKSGTFAGASLKSKTSTSSSRASNNKSAMHSSTKRISKNSIISINCKKQ
jgi:hypothetical protein